jgi:allantoinase
MKRAAALGKIVAVHAESEAMTARLAEEKNRAGKTSIRDYLDSRPVEAELDAIQRALDLAGETGCRLHIVHVSCGAGIEAIANAKKKGVDVSCETCPHYLTLTEDDMIRIGALAKCAPPLRTATAQETLWQSIATGKIDTIGSDHSPSPASMKADANYFKVWGGVSGIQHALPLLLSEGYARRKLPLPLLGRLMSFNVAERFRLPNGIGQITEGADASLVLVDLGASYQVELWELFYRHQQTPYAGRSLTGKVVETILRGQTVYKDGKIMCRPAARLVKPRAG